MRLRFKGVGGAFGLRRGLIWLAILVVGGAYLFSMG